MEKVTYNVYKFLPVDQQYLYQKHFRDAHDPNPYAPEPPAPKTRKQIVDELESHKAAQKTLEQQLHDLQPGELAEFEQWKKEKEAQSA
jgi:hypothetical protein